jgi:membrane-associated HD superfamily phosphohydrolase
MIENQQELKFSGEQGFFDKSKIIRYCVLFLFVLTLFAFLHFREVKVEILELNSVAPSYIVSQINFDFSDEEATIILRQDAVRKLGKIYQISQADIYRKRIEYENFLLYNQAWYTQTENVVFEELYQAIDILEKALTQLRFTDVRTLELLKKKGLSTKGYEIYTPPTLSEPILLPSFIWDNIQKTDFPPAKHNPFITDLIINFFKESHWHIEDDIPTQRRLRKNVQIEIPEKTTHVNAGNRIIDQGEKVTARHIAMLQAMKNELGESRNLSHFSTLLGTAILTILFVGFFLIYFKINQPNLLLSNRKLFLLVTIVILTLALSKLTEFFLLNSKNSLIEIIRYPLFVPLAAILICSLMNARAATFIIGFHFCNRISFRMGRLFTSQFKRFLNFNS